MTLTVMAAFIAIIMIVLIVILVRFGLSWVSMMSRGTYQRVLGITGVLVAVAGVLGRIYLLGRIMMVVGAVIVLISISIGQRNRP